MKLGFDNAVFLSIVLDHNNEKFGNFCQLVARPTSDDGKVMLIPVRNGVNGSATWDHLCFATTVESDSRVCQ